MVGQFLMITSGKMIFERLVGVSLYFIVTLFFYYKIKTSSNYKSINRCFNILLIILTVMAFFYIPAESADISRLREIGDQWIGYSIPEFIRNVVPNNTSPLAYFYIYLFQKTRIQGLLPAFCAFVFYLNLFHVFKITYLKLNVKNEALALTFLFVMSCGSFLEVIAGVRCFVAFSIIARCFVDEAILKKSIIRYIIFYLMACLIHTAALPLFAARLFVMLFEKGKPFYYKIINVLSFLFIGFLAIKYGNSIVEDSLNRGIGYATTDKYSYIWEHLIGIISFIVIVGCLYEYLSIKKIRKDAVKYNIILFLAILVIIEFCCLAFYNIFHRFLIPCYFLIVPIMSYVFSNRKSTYTISPTTKLTLFKLTCFILFFIACARGNLCGYKFFLL